MYLDGVYALNLTLETIYKNKIKVGMQIDSQTLSQIQFDSEKQIAFEKCLKLLSTSLKTKNEVAIYLKNKGYTQAIIEYVLEKLTEYKYLDDQTYAKTFVEINKKTKGKKMLEFMLKTKGVSSEIIGEVLKDLNQEDEILELAKKFMKGKNFDAQTKQKLYRYLLSKGFNYEQCGTATAKIFSKKED